MNRIFLLCAIIVVATATTNVTQPTDHIEAMLKNYLITANFTDILNLVRGFISSLFAKLNAPQAAMCMNVTLNIGKIISDIQYLVKQKFEFVRMLSLVGNIFIEIIAIMDNCYDVYVGFNNIWQCLVKYSKNPIYWLGQIGENLLYNILDLLVDLGAVYTYMDEGDFYNAGEIGGEFVYNVFFTSALS